MSAPTTDKLNDLRECPRPEDLDYPHSDVPVTVIPDREMVRFGWGSESIHVDADDVIMEVNSQR